MDTNTDATETISTETEQAPTVRKRTRGSRKQKLEPKSRLVTATLPKRLIRVQFRVGKKVVATSPFYNSGNTVQKIVAYARQVLKPGSEAIAATQVQGGKLVQFKG